MAYSCYSVNYAGLGIWLRQAIGHNGTTECSAQRGSAGTPTPALPDESTGASASSKRSGKSTGLLLAATPPLTHLVTRVMLIRLIHWPRRGKSAGTQLLLPVADHRRVNPKRRRQLRQGLLPRQRCHRHARLVFRAVLLPLYAHLSRPFGPVSL